MHSFGRSPKRRCLASLASVGRLDQLDHATFLMLPSLSGRIPDWIVADPQRDNLLGICRRAWSQNQVQRKLLATPPGYCLTQTSSAWPQWDRSIGARCIGRNDRYGR